MSEGRNAAVLGSLRAVAQAARNCDPTMFWSALTVLTTTLKAIAPFTSNKVDDKVAALLEHVQTDAKTKALVNDVLHALHGCEDLSDHTIVPAYHTGDSPVPAYKNTTAGMDWFTLIMLITEIIKNLRKPR